MREPKRRMTLDEAREILKGAMGREIDFWHYECGSAKSPGVYIRMMGANYKQFGASADICADDPLLKAAKSVLRLRAKRAGIDRNRDMKEAEGRQR